MSARGLTIYQLQHESATQNGDEQDDPLQLAVQLGDTEMCRLLICEGEMNPRSALTRGHDGQLVMKIKPRVNEEVILPLLREHATTS
jgi:hypothetical protein